MPYNLPPDLCKQCPYALNGCVSYVGDISFKDRDTEYRLSQKTITACVFDNWLPGAWNSEAHQHAADADTSWVELLTQLGKNGTIAGHTRTASRQLFQIAKGFSLTRAQLAKVQGDVFQLLVGAVLWNACVAHNQQQLASGQPGPIYAALTLGDNYKLGQLFEPGDARRLKELQDQLALSNTSLAYSTPDFVVVDISRLGPETRLHFNQRLTNLSFSNQDTLANARLGLKGHLNASDIVAAIGLKTSIRSDRMYQLLFEANAWKFIWRAGFGLEPSKYYAVYGGSYGTNPVKLASVDFSSLEKATGHARRAIDGALPTRRPSDLVRQFATILQDTPSRPAPPPNPLPLTLF